MNMTGCQGRAKEISLQEKACPQCGHEIEIFSVDTQAVCENCGFVIYNDTISCVQWCKNAKLCVGAELYEKLMRIAERKNPPA
jgi:DNA-directed RNA polymerase subunit RPC12/RpoP